jgi:hypothetical protein
MPEDGSPVRVLLVPAEHVRRRAEVVRAEALGAGEQHQVFRRGQIGTHRLLASAQGERLRGPPKARS